MIDFRSIKEATLRPASPPTRRGRHVASNRSAPPEKVTRRANQDRAVDRIDGKAAKLRHDRPARTRKLERAVARLDPDTMPESPATLKAQQRQLVRGDRNVQMFPRGTAELPLPRSMKRIATPNGHAFHYDPREINPAEIKRLASRGRENELLGLGPVSKGEAVVRGMHGEIPVAVVERQRDGTEVRGAAGTDRTARRQAAALERAKTPGNVVGVENPAFVLARRVSDHRS